jgi:hypothetical protein
MVGVGVLDVKLASDSPVCLGARRLRSVISQQNHW